jgi:integrase
MHRHNHLKRQLQPLAEKLGIAGLTYQALRRTHATHFQRHGDLKDTQAQLRHSDASTTMNIYVQSIPESQKAAAEAWNEEISGLLEAIDQEIAGLLNTNEHKFEM